MYDNRVFAGGISALLVAEWHLRCETPLVIRNGKTVRYTEDNDYAKERGGNLRFEWEPWTKPSGAHAVAALCYRYQVEGNTLRLVHQVPASALRGCLRSWTINHLAQAEYRSCLLPPPKDDSEGAHARAERLKQALADRASGLPLLASLFGMALETTDEELDLANAGRLLVQTEPFAGAPGQPIEANGHVVQGMAGPDNARRHMAVRNPLDRITHAARDGGLHHFLEFATGESFAARLTIRNPMPADVGLLSAWGREIGGGTLRLGALSSIGRGRLSIESPRYTLWWQGTSAPDPDQWPGLELDPEQDDVLVGLYQPYRLATESLSAYEPHVAEAVR